MDIKVDKQGELVRVALVGNIDELGSDELKAKLMGMQLAGTSQVDIDFTGVTYIGSAGIGKLLLFYKKIATQDIKVTLRNLPPAIHQKFESVKLNQIFTLE